MRAGSTMAMYWSDAVMFVNTQLARTAPIRLPAPRTVLRMAPAMRCSMPQASSMPPKTIAQMISQIVGSMLDMPPRENSSSIVRLLGKEGW